MRRAACCRIGRWSCCCMRLLLQARMTECEAVRARGGRVERRQAKGAQPPPPPPPRFLLLSSSTHDARGWQWSAALGTLQRTGVVSSFLRPTGPLKLKAPRQVSGRHSKAAEVGTGVCLCFTASTFRLCVRRGSPLRIRSLHDSGILTSR